MKTSVKSDQVVVDLGGRRFAGTALAERFVQPIPNVEFFRELAASIRQKSAILALSSEGLNKKSPIYTAYAHDLAMLRRCHIAAFLNSVPASLEPHLSIVEGMITMEERHRRLIAEGTRTETEILSVYKGSPGVLLGPFNLIGWSDDDLASGGVFSSKQKAAQRKPHSVSGHLFTS